MGQADTRLRVRIVRAFRSQKDQVERCLVGLDGVTDRLCRSLRIDICGVGADPNRSISADGELLSNLFLDPLRPHRDQCHRPTVLFLQLHGCFHRALLVRAQSESELVGVDRHAVVGQHDGATEGRVSLDAYANVHQLRIRSLVGSNNGVAPTRSTTTG